MTRRISKSRITVAVALAYCVFTQNSIHAQTAWPSAPGATINAGNSAMRAGNGAPYVGTNRNRNRSKMLRDLQILQDRLKDSVNKSGEGLQQQQVTDEIESSLSKYFDDDMVMRRSDFQRLEKRVVEAEAQLSSRASAKQELVDLQVESFTYEADGLELLGDNGRKNSSDFRVRAGVAAYAVAGAPQLASNDAIGVTQKQRIEDALRDLKQAKSAKTKEGETRALLKLNAALGEYFDSDMEFRRKEIDEIKVGLRKMESLLERRVKSKRAIIGLQLRMIVNEAKGLGFFSGASISENLLQLR